MLSSLPLLSQPGKSMRKTLIISEGVLGKHSSRSHRFRALPVSKHAPHQLGSTVRRKACILVNVHSVLHQKQLTQQHQLPRSRPSGQPIERSQLGPTASDFQPPLTVTFVSALRYRHHDRRFHVWDRRTLPLDQMRPAEAHLQ